MNIEPGKKELMRRAFPPALIGKLPRTSKRPALDYVGHAAVTDRLQAVDEDWTFTIDREFEHGAEFWIRGTLTVGGVSRPEYGQGPNPLEAVSHFIRRAAMRFGIALDLWSKEELHSAELEPRTVTPSTDPESTRDPAGMGDAEGADPRGSVSAPDRPGGEALGEGVTPPGPNDGSDATDLSAHPNKPHHWKPAPDFPGYEMCTVGKCRAWAYVGKETK